MSALPSVSSWIAPALPVVTLRFVALPETWPPPDTSSTAPVSACSAPRMIEPPLIACCSRSGPSATVLTQEPETSMRALAPSLTCPDGRLTEPPGARTVPSMATGTLVSRVARPTLSAAPGSSLSTASFSSRKPLPTLKVMAPRPAASSVSVESQLVLV